MGDSILRSKFDRISLSISIIFSLVIAVFVTLPANAVQSTQETNANSSEVIQTETKTCELCQNHPFNENIPKTVLVPAGNFIFGSDRAEREYAYQLDQQAYGHSVTRDSKWYETEASKQMISLGQFEITSTPITNRQYKEFVTATNYPAPKVDRDTWESYGLVHPYERTKRHTWRDNKPPQGRDDHPVVLVSYTDAIAYADWLTSTTQYKWRLPTEREWVKAVRGPTGWRFPWGDVFDAKLLNSHDSGPFDTVEVGALSQPNIYGLVDTAGQVFEWIKTAPDAKRAWVKGGSWDDKGCGVCRPAARHSRPILLKHILIGFRLIKE